MRQITLNPLGGMSALVNILQDCSNSVYFGLQAITIVNEIPKFLEVEGGFFRLQVGDDINDIYVKKEQFKRWLLKKGFEDLIKGIEASLIEAYIYSSLLAQALTLTTQRAFDEAHLLAKRTISKMHLPQMIDAVEQHLSRPLLCKDEILTINKARTCLVHRQGKVTDKDINSPLDDSLTLKWRRLKLFYTEKGKVTEIKKQLQLESDTEVSIQQESSMISFKLGTFIDLNYQQFNEFVLTCLCFGNDVADALKK